MHQATMQAPPIRVARSRHFGRTGRVRMFEQGDLRYVVLKLISEKASYGYEIIKAIEDRVGGRLRAQSPASSIRR